MTFEELLPVFICPAVRVTGISHACPVNTELFLECCLCTEEKGSPLLPGEAFFRRPFRMKECCFGVLCGKPCLVREEGNGPSGGVEQCSGRWGGRLKLHEG